MPLPPEPLPPVGPEPPPPAPLPLPAPASCPTPTAGEFWKTPDGRIFVFLDDALHWIPDLATFQAWAFTWENVREVALECPITVALGHPLPRTPEPAPEGEEVVEVPEELETEEAAVEEPDSGGLELEAEMEELDVEEP